MSLLGATLEDAVDQLRDAGLNATLDPRELTRLPAVWVKLDALVGPTLSGGVANRGKAQVTVYALVQAADPLRVYVALGDLIAQVAAVIPPHSDLRHVSLALPGGGVPAPAMSYTHDLLLGE